MRSILINDRNSYKKLSGVIIICFTFLMFVSVLSKQTEPIGEADDYLLATISLVDRGTLFFQQSDLEQAKKDFPSFYVYLQKEFDTAMGGNYSMFIGPDGTPHAWYFFTYPLLCIPLKLFFQYFDVNQLYAFSLTNLLIYVAALLTIVFGLKRDDKTKFFMVLLMACNPAIFYMNWTSAEVTLCAFVVISLVFFANKEHNKAAFFVSLAGTLNATIMIYGSIIFFDYFKNLFWKTGSIQQVFKSNKVAIVKFLACFIPAFLPFIYNFYNFGVLSLQCFLNQNTWGYLGHRFMAYLSDFNFGILPYFPLLLLAFLIITLWGLIKRDYITCLYVFAFYGTIAAYSIINTLDAGMTGIARYNIWTLPILITYLVVYGDRLMPCVQILRGTYIISAFVCVSIIIWYGGVFPNKAISSQMLPIAKVALQYMPNIYSPFYQTFMTRIKLATWDKDGWADRDGQPWIYTDSDGYARKILATSNNVEELRQSLYGSEGDMQYLSGEIAKVSALSGRNYLNFPWFVHLRVKDTAIYEKHRYLINAEYSLNDHMVMPSEMMFLGNPKVVDGQVFLEKDMVCYGPYAPLAKGRYRAVIYGRNLDKASFDVAYDLGKKQVALDKVDQQNSTISYEFTLSEDVEKIEFRVFNRENAVVIFEKIALDKM